MTTDNLTYNSHIEHVVMFINTLIFVLIIVATKFISLRSLFEAMIRCIIFSTKQKSYECDNLWKDWSKLKRCLHLSYISLEGHENKNVHIKNNGSYGVSIIIDEEVNTLDKSNFNTFQTNLTMINEILESIYSLSINNFKY